MKHTYWLDQLPFYAAGQLSAAERAALERHLQGCDSCRAAAEQWKRIAAGVRQQAAGRAYRLPPLPTHKLPLQEKKMNTAYTVPFPHTAPRRQPALTLIAVMVIVAVFAGGMFLLSGRNSHDPLTSGAARQSSSATPSPSPTWTPPPTNTPAPDELLGQVQMTATVLVVQATAAMAAQMTPDAVHLQDNITYEAQDWNNAGPANLVMALSYWGVDLGQDQAAGWLKPNPEDKHVTPEQITYYVNQYTSLQSIYRLGGTPDLLRSLLAAGFPVIIQTGFEPEGEEWLGHYRLIVGYEGSTFYVYDSLLGSGTKGEGITIDESELNTFWRQFNHIFMVIYPVEQIDQLRAALGGYRDPHHAIMQALNVAAIETQQQEADIWSWLNLCSSYAALGNYEQAMEAYNHVDMIDLPWRLPWYRYDLYAAYLYSGIAGTGDKPQTVIELADYTLATTLYVEEAYYWRALGYAASGNFDAAGADLAKVLELNPNFFEAQAGEYHIAADPLQILQGIPPVIPVSTEQPPVIAPPVIVTATPISADEPPTVVPPVIVTATPISADEPPTIAPLEVMTATPFPATTAQ